MADEEALISSNACRNCSLEQFSSAFYLIATDLPLSPFSLREKVAEGRMRGQQGHINQLCPLTLTLSLRERGLFNCHGGRLVLLRSFYNV
jgi:hypothetical protein